MAKTTFEILMIVVTLLTLILQCYVAYMVHRKSPVNMKEYKYFLNLFIGFDILFNILFGLFLQPYPIAPNVAASCRGISQLFGFEACLITTSIVFVVGANVMFSQYYCLVYRYTVTHENAYVHRLFMSKRTKILIAIFSQLFMIFFGILSYKNLEQGDQVPYYYSRAPYFLEPLIPGDYLILINNFKLNTLLYIIGIAVVFLIGEVLSISLVYVTLAKLRRKSFNYSKKTYKLHVQFTILVGVQLLTPIVFIAGPVCAAAICIFLQIPAPNVMAQVGLIWLTLYGATNSIFTVIFVGPYRKHTYEQIILPCLQPICSLFDKKHWLYPKLTTETPQTSNNEDVAVRTETSHGNRVQPA